MSSWGSAEALLRVLPYRDLERVARAIERQALADMGLNSRGRWVGFDEAARQLAAEDGTGVAS